MELRRADPAPSPETAPAHFGLANRPQAVKPAERPALRPSVAVTAAAGGNRATISFASAGKRH